MRLLDFEFAVEAKKKQRLLVRRLESSQAACCQVAENDCFRDEQPSKLVAVIGEMDE